MKRIVSTWLCILLLLFFGMPSEMMAQKKELIAARDQVKAGKDLDKAQASMTKLLADSAHRDNKKIWSTLFDAVRKQYEQGNEKLYLKQTYDTAKLFNLAKQLFIVAEGLDSVEMVPDKKGKRNIEFRKSHADYLNRIRPNIYNGGTWFVRKQQYKDAYAFFDLYIDCAQSSLFQSYHFDKKDAHLSQAAYWAVYCGYKMKDSKATLHHSYEALKDTVHYNYMLQYLAETYKLDNDTVRYVSTLKEGFKRAPKFSFFFPRLVEFYSSQNQPDSAMKVVDEALRIEAENHLYLYAKSTILLNQGKYKECIAICDKVIAAAKDGEKQTADSEHKKNSEDKKSSDDKNGNNVDDDAEKGIYYNAGLSYYNMAVELDKNRQQSSKLKAEISTDYKKALPYLEKYRSLAPNMTDQWALPLYTIYLNLNMGKEFDEIDKLLNQKK